MVLLDNGVFMSDVSILEFLKKSKFNLKKANYYKKMYSKIMELGLFDEKFYLSSYPHIKNSGMDPLVHYLFHGYKEGKKPTANFDLEKYLKKFPEIEKNSLNPIIHYIENNNEGFIRKYNPFEIMKERILSTNLSFLNNYEFDEEPLVSIIILNRNGLNHLKVLFKDFDKKTNYSNYEIIVVDNASCDQSVEYLYSLKKDLPIKIIENIENVSFSKGNNDAAKIANGKYLLLLNNDIEPTYGWLNEMMGTMLNNDNVGAVGAKLIFPYYEDILNQPKSFSIQHASVKFREELTPYIYGPYHENMFNTLIFRNNLNTSKKVISNTAACILIPKSVYTQLDGLDENYFYGYEDIDFAFKLYEAGYDSIFNPQALLFHHESATRVDDERKNQLNYENIMYFFNKWGDLLFKEMLRDKLEGNRFFTNKKLDFSIINTHDGNKEFIKELSQELNKKYNVLVLSNLNNKILGPNCDIVISFNPEYEINKTISRLNLIKILVLNNLNDEYQKYLDNYDLVLTKDFSLENGVLFKSRDGKSFSNELLKIISDYYIN